MRYRCPHVTGAPPWNASWRGRDSALARLSTPHPQSHFTRTLQLYTNQPHTRSLTQRNQCSPVATQEIDAGDSRPIMPQATPETDSESQDSKSYDAEDDSKTHSPLPPPPPPSLELPTPPSDGPRHYDEAYNALQLQQRTWLSPGKRINPGLQSPTSPIPGQVLFPQQSPIFINAPMTPNPGDTLWIPQSPAPFPPMSPNPLGECFAERKRCPSFIYLSLTLHHVCSRSPLLALRRPFFVGVSLAQPEGPTHAAAAET
jgi:hypothetical protein